MVLLVPVVQYVASHMNKRLGHDLQMGMAEPEPEGFRPHSAPGDFPQPRRPVLKKITVSLFLFAPVLWCQYRIASPNSRAITISHVQATASSTSATITWTTNFATTSIVNYGATTAYGNTASDTNLTTQHSITLSNLSSSTAYNYDVQSATTRSSATSGNNAFQTLVAAVPPPTTNPTPTSTPSNLWIEIAADMTGSNEAYPQGVPLSYDWAQGPTIVMGNNPNGWQAITAWGVVTIPTQGNPATNTRVNIRNVQLYLLQHSTGAWLLLQNTSQPQGADYLDDFSGDISQPGDVRPESDGTISVTAGGGYCFHFWPQDRASINPNDIGGILVLLQARLIVGNPSLPDDRNIAQYLAGSGADYYPALTGGWPGNLSYNPGVGTGKLKFVQSDWRFYAMTTLTAAQLASDPPPVNLTGINP